MRNGGGAATLSATTAAGALAMRPNRIADAKPRILAAAKLTRVAGNMAVVDGLARYNRQWIERELEPTGDAGISQDPGRLHGVLDDLRDLPLADTK